MKHLNENGCDEHLSVAQCEEFATYNLDSVVWRGKKDAKPAYPKGCYLMNNNVFFNPASYGSPHENAQPACIKQSDNICFCSQNKITISRRVNISKLGKFHIDRMCHFQTGVTISTLYQHT